MVLASSSAYADEWTRTDTVMQTVYSVLHVADWSQTLQIEDNAEPREDGTKLSEANKILGAHPSRDWINLYFTSALIGHYYVAKNIDRPYRRAWQLFWIYAQYNIIEHNKRNGLTVRFKY